MTRLGAPGLRALTFLTLMALVCAGCTRTTSAAANAQPADLYAATPSLSDVRSLLGDTTWWPGPPSFQVRPLDAASMPTLERFAVTERFIHLGTAETFEVTYSLWSTTSAATAQMSNIQAAFGTSATGTKAGDQVFYYGSQGSGAAPYETATVVRVGSLVATVSWNRKDGLPTLAQLGKIALKVASHLKDISAGKVHSSPLPSSDTAVLPPLSQDITLLGSAEIPIEAAVVMINPTSLEGLAAAFHSIGVDTMVFGDYVLDNDTHMEVRAGELTFLTQKDATTWLDLLRGSYSLDQNGVAGFYDAGSGQYFFLFVSGTRGGMLVCRSTSDTEAASRACEAPLTRVAPAWKLSLGG